MVCVAIISSSTDHLIDHVTRYEAEDDELHSWAVVGSPDCYVRYGRVAEPGGPPSRAGHLDIGPGEAISLLPRGIHSISAIGSARLMMMHCYARPFDAQDARLEFDLSAGTCAVGRTVTGEIRDVALHAEVIGS